MGWSRFGLSVGSHTRERREAFPLSCECPSIKLRPCGVWALTRMTFMKDYANQSRLLNSVKKPTVYPLWAIILFLAAVAGLICVAAF